LQAVDRGDSAALILLDLSAAYDKVDNSGALKMEERKMQDWILKDHFTGAMALYAVKSTRYSRLQKKRKYEN